MHALQYSSSTDHNVEWMNQSIETTVSSIERDSVIISFGESRIRSQQSKNIDLFEEYMREALCCIHNIEMALIE